jgi:hypothetical protein
MAAAGHGAIDLEQTSAGLERAVVGHVAQNLESTRSTRNYRPVVREGCVAGIDDEMIGGIGRGNDPSAVIDKRKVAVTDMAEAIDGIVDILQRVVAIAIGTGDGVRRPAERNRAVTFQKHLPVDFQGCARDLALDVDIDCS